MEDFKSLIIEGKWGFVCDMIWMKGGFVWWVPVVIISAYALKDNFKHDLRGILTVCFDHVNVLPKCSLFIIHIIKDSQTFILSMNKISSPTIWNTYYPRDDVVTILNLLAWLDIVQSPCAHHLWSNTCRYGSGDRLSPEHEKTILDRLLPYHPECEKKIGCGIDYITVFFSPHLFAHYIPCVFSLFEEFKFTLNSRLNHELLILYLELKV